jgi:hypothetical protein
MIFSGPANWEGVLSQDSGKSDARLRHLPYAALDKKLIKVFL